MKNPRIQFISFLEMKEWEFTFEIFKLCGDNQLPRSFFYKVKKELKILFCFECVCWINCLIWWLED